MEESFLECLLPKYVGRSDEQSTFYIEKFVSYLRDGQIEDFMRHLQSFFADTPYELIRDTENHYQNVMFTLCRLLGYYTKAEYHTSDGRIDMVVKTERYVYVFEFKFDQSASVALSQINDKDYPLPFRCDSRRLFKVGVNFSSKTRNIDAWEWEKGRKN